MIWEALQHLFISTAPPIKAMGYLKESIAIEARYKRCASSWAPHLNECKAQILNVAKDLHPQSNIMILGSGGLHDVPMDELLKQDFQICCVDLVHLPHVKKKYPSVNFIEHDITGQIIPLYEAINTKGMFFPEPSWHLKEKPDLIISLNILSQLAINPMNYAKAKNFELGPFFENSTYGDHITWLKDQKTEVLLISDMTREYYEDGTLIENLTALPKLDLDEPIKTWPWDIAPIGEADPKINIRHIVGVWSI